MRPNIRTYASVLKLTDTVGPPITVLKTHAYIIENWQYNAPYESIVENDADLTDVGSFIYQVNEPNAEVVK